MYDLEKNHCVGQSQLPYGNAVRGHTVYCGRVLTNSRLHFQKNCYDQYIKKFLICLRTCIAVTMVLGFTPHLK